MLLGGDGNSISGESANRFSNRMNGAEDKMRWFAGVDGADRTLCRLLKKTHSFRFALMYCRPTPHITVVTLDDGYCIVVVQKACRLENLTHAIPLEDPAEYCPQQKNGVKGSMEVVLVRPDMRLSSSNLALLGSRSF